jgi:hypothetical protein
VIIGITGHQELGDAETIRWVRATISREVSVRRPEYGLSSLAAGADQLFVEVLQSAGISYQAVLPCRGYETTFATHPERERFRDLLSRAVRIHQLPFSGPCEEAFFAAGKWIIGHCDLLLAVWNGLPARGLGGTGDVVAFAQSCGRRWLHVNPAERWAAEP